MESFVYKFAKTRPYDERHKIVVREISNWANGQFVGLTFTHPLRNFFAIAVVEREYNEDTMLELEKMLRREFGSFEAYALDDATKVKSFELESNSAFVLKREILLTTLPKDEWKAKKKILKSLLVSKFDVPIKVNRLVGNGLCITVDGTEYCWSHLTQKVRKFFENDKVLNRENFLIELTGVINEWYVLEVCGV